MLENKAVVFHQAIHAVIFYICSAESHGTWICIPKTWKQKAQRRLSSATRTYNRSSCVLRDFQRDIIDDFSFFICKIDRSCLNIVVFRLNICTVDIHCRKVQNRICFWYADIDCAEQCRIVASCFKCVVQHEWTDKHCYTIGNSHRAVQIKENRSEHHCNSAQLWCQCLKAWNRNAAHFHFDKCFYAAIDYAVQFFSAAAWKVVCFYFSNPLNIFQNFSYLCRIVSDFFRRNIFYSKAHKYIYKFKKCKAGKGDQSDSPVKCKKHNDDKRSIEHSLKYHHDNSRCNIAKSFHRVCCNRCDFSKAVFIEVSHRQVTKMFRNFDSFFCTCSVTAFALPHCCKFSSYNSSDNASAHYRKRKPYCFCFEWETIKRSSRNAANHNCDSSDP